MFRVRDPQASPYLGRLGIERQNVVGVFPKNEREPGFKTRDLAVVAPMAESRADSPTSIMCR
jgi:hypothetical protein